MEKLTQTEDSILRALQYSSIFSYPLSFFQIGLYADKKLTYKELEASLKNLVEKGGITKRENVYKLKGGKSVNWKQKQAQSKKLFKKYS